MLASGTMLSAFIVVVTGMLVVGGSIGTNLVVVLGFWVVEGAGVVDSVELEVWVVVAVVTVVGDSVVGGSVGINGVVSYFTFLSPSLISTVSFILTLGNFGLTSLILVELLVSPSMLSKNVVSAVNSSNS